MYWFHIYRDTAASWRWPSTREHRRMGDSGESYATRQGCEEAVLTLKRIVRTADVRSQLRDVLSTSSHRHA
jgi:uncharacterized protein YegP (UPF0339 family)